MAVKTSASVAISTIPLLFVVAKSSFCKIKLVPSYTTVYTPFARITPVCGSLPSLVLILSADGQKLTVQAQVLAVEDLKESFCPVVYAASTGVRATTYVSSPPASRP